MAKSKGFNGHKNWNHWNVSLWINNDAGLYALAIACVRRCRNRDIAAQQFLDHMHLVCRKTETPDGAPYSKTTIRAAMVGM